MQVKEGIIHFISTTPIIDNIRAKDGDANKTIIEWPSFKGGEENKAAQQSVFCEV